ncbi:MAG: LptF/LptG family permease [Gemmatimonadetes bacterium]|nr:LptF/LptG family permease [Gemmatimonadota bacterium]
MKILTRYVLREHAGPFLAATLVLTGLMLLNQVARRMDELAGKGLPWNAIAEVFLLSLPFILAMTIPMAVLVAVCYAFGRLSGDGELTALKASGIGLPRLCLSPLAAAALVCAFMVWFSDEVVPDSNHALRRLLVDIAQKKPTFNLREQMVNEVVRGKLFVRASKIDRRTNMLYDVAIYDLGGPDLVRTIYAESGPMAFDETGTDLFLTLRNGVLQEVDFRDPGSSRVTRFHQHMVRARGVQDQLERGRSGDYRGDREMDIAMMREQVARARANLEAALDSARSLTATALAIASVPQSVAANRGAGPPATVPLEVQSTRYDADRARARAADRAALFARRYREYALRAEIERGEMNRFLVEIHKKFGIPAAAIVFVLIGAPLGARFPRGGMGIVLLVSLVVFNVYYVGLIAGEDLADRNIITPFWAMWAPNVLFALLGVALLYREGRESATARGGGWEEFQEAVRHALRPWRWRARPKKGGAPQ